MVSLNFLVRQKNIPSVFLERILLLLIVVSVFVAPSIVFDDFINKTVTSKTVFFHYSCSILLGVYTLRILFYNNINIAFSKLDYALIVLICYFMVNRYIIQSDYGFSLRFYELIGLIAFYLVLRTMPRLHFYWILLAVIVSGSVQAVYGNLQLLGYFSSHHSLFNITGSFFNPGPYAGFLACVWILSLGCHLYRDQNIPKVALSLKSNQILQKKGIQLAFGYLPICSLVTITLVIPATKSRAAWLVLLIGGALLILKKYKLLNRLTLIRKSKSLQKTVLMLGILTMIGSGSYGLYHLKKDSADGRLLVWNVSKDIAQDYPLFGVGFDRFRSVYMDYQAAYFSKKGSKGEKLLAGEPKYAFNEYLQLLIENGVFGLLLLCGIVYYIWTLKIDEDQKRLGTIVKSTLLGMSIFAFFSYPIQILPVKIVLVLLLAVLAVLDSDKTSIIVFKEEESKKRFAFKIVLLLIVMPILFLSITFTNGLIKDFREWSEASFSYNSGLYETSADEYSKILSRFHDNGDFMTEYGKALVLDKKYPKGLEVLLQAQKLANNTVVQIGIGDCYRELQEYLKAEAAYQKASYMKPTLFYPEYLLAKLYKEIGQDTKARAQAKAILQKTIKVPSPAIKEIKDEMRKILETSKNRPPVNDI